MSVETFTAGLPNYHPLLVHFLIGLLVYATVMDVIQVILRRPTKLKNTSPLYLAGTVLLALAYFSCRDASAIYVFAVTSLIGLVLLVTTADLGGRLVYRYGVGVATVSASP